LRKPSAALVDRASLLTLTAPQMTALVGGMRALGANAGDTRHGMFTDRPGRLTTDFFRNLLDMRTAWSKSETQAGVFEGRDRRSGELRWTATIADLMFGSNAQLRALSEVYAADDGEAHFVQDFIQAWAKVMDLDRFDVRYAHA
jgi:catalase-peroxidase